MKSRVRRLLQGLFVVALTVVSFGCGDRCETCDPTAPSAPTAPACSFTIVPTAQHFPYQGGAGNVVVTTQSGCSWNAVSNSAWLTVTNAGGGSVSYTVQANTGGARTGTLTVAGQTVTITQDGAPAAPPRPPQPQPSPSPTPEPPQPTPPPVTCTYAVQETPQQFTYQGGNGGFSVSASRSSCTWTAVSNVAWIAITGGSPGSGNGTVSYIVAGNGGPARTGTISVAGKTVTVKQSAQ